MIAKDLITHLLCVDASQRYTIDEFLAHPWCNAAPAPPPPPTPFIYGNNNPMSLAPPLDSPLLSAARGGRAEGRSPGLAVLKEAFDVTYAVHRMEEEGARRRKYKGRGGAGQRGFLQGLNEDDEDEYDADGDAETVASRSAGLPAAHAKARGSRAYENAAPAPAVAQQQARRNAGPKGFELDMDGSTLLGRRHKRTVPAKSPLANEAFAPTAMSPLATAPEDYSRMEPALDPGSPMHIN